MRYMLNLALLTEDQVHQWERSPCTNRRNDRCHEKHSICHYRVRQDPLLEYQYFDVEMDRWDWLTIIVVTFLRIALVDGRTRVGHQGQFNLSRMICFIVGDRSVEGLDNQQLLLSDCNMCRCVD